MLTYITKRFFSMLITLVGIIFLTFFIMASSPGGPISAMTDFNPTVSAEVKERLVKLYELDKPIHIQFLKWCKRMVRFDFGTSFKDNRPVIEKVWERLPRTLLLSVLSLILAFIFAIPIGIISALKHNTLTDRTLTVLVFLGYSMPMYWIALLLMIGFGIHLGWFPVTGFRSIMADELSLFGQVLDIANHLVLPLVVTSLTGLALLSRYARYEMLETIRQDFIRTARAKGLTEKRVVLVHALRNILIPFITILGLSLPGLISMGVIFETIFTFPGLGRLMFEAIMARDYPVIMATGTFVAFLTLIGNLIADISYAYADPRIRYR